MKTVGHRRTEPPITSEPSGESLARLARANNAMRALAGGAVGLLAKGVYRFDTLAEADRHREDYVAEAMARFARERQ